MAVKVTCPECGRVFDLLDEQDAAEWAYGHDCEAIKVILSDVEE